MAFLRVKGAKGLLLPDLTGQVEKNGGVPKDFKDDSFLGGIQVSLA